MTAQSDDGATRQLPVIDASAGFFWTGGSTGRLLIQRCAHCGQYQHPPQPLCTACHGQDVLPVPVVGTGRVRTFTVNHQPWRPGMAVPFVFGAIELDEQPELYVFSNIVGEIKEIHSGMTVSVTFERHEDVWIPLFEAVRSGDDRG